MPCLFFYALLNAYRLVLVVVPAGLRAVLVLVVVAAGLRAVLVLVVVAAGLRAVLVLVVGFVVGFVVVVVAGLREVLVVVVCVRSSPALRIVTPEPLADTRLSNAYSGCC